MSLLDLIGVYAICAVIAWMYLKIFADLIAPALRRDRRRAR